MQLEFLNFEMNSVAGSCTSLSKEEMQQALEQVNLVHQDRVALQVMGHFRTAQDVAASMDYITAIVNNDNTRMSQLKNALYKVQSEMLLKVIH